MGGNQEGFEIRSFFPLAGGKKRGRKLGGGETRAEGAREFFGRFPPQLGGKTSGEGFEIRRFFPPAGGKNVFSPWKMRRESLKITLGRGRRE